MEYYNKAKSIEEKEDHSLVSEADYAANDIIVSAIKEKYPNHAILSEESLVLIRRTLKKATDVMVSPEELIGAIRYLLNEAAIAEMEKIKISLPVKKQQKKKIIPAISKDVDNTSENSNSQAM